ncbi:helix-turn-helix domain-containing protein [Saccharopolyspora hattusasensis]|uniref:helix-turn-helix domain-containing protein n=1 Tax=Saccharopolyspora hattusasensis TaxID=1128679 RepID=UPI003D992E9B
MSATTPAIGQRIATARKLAGLTQFQLAEKANYSEAMVQAVEQGKKPASPRFIASAAKALSIEPELLTGQPYHFDDEKPLEGLPELRALIAEGTEVIVAPPAPLSELEADLAQISKWYWDDKGAKSLAAIPTFLRQVYGAAHAANSVHDRGRAYTLLSAGWAQAEQLSRRFGALTLSVPCLDRLDAVAQHADDPVYAAKATQKRARVLMYYGTFDSGRAARSAERLAELPDSEPILAARGSAHLCTAIVAARGGDRPTARAHLREARELGARVGHESPHYGTKFGPGNVTIHEVAVALEAGDPEQAARLGSSTRLPADVSSPRLAHHWQDVARAWLLSGDPARSLQALNMARKVAPQQTRRLFRTNDRRAGFSTLWVSTSRHQCDVGAVLARSVIVGRG